MSNAAGRDAPPGNYVANHVAGTLGAEWFEPASTPIPRNGWLDYRCTPSPEPLIPGSQAIDRHELPVERFGPQGQLENAPRRNPRFAPRLNHTELIQWRTA